MYHSRLTKALERAVQSAGEDAVVSALREMAGDNVATANILTLIGNAGVHRIPERYRMGEVYEVSRGSWAIESKEQLNGVFSELLADLVRKLREKAWSKIYFIPTGHPALSIQVKTLIYRVLRQNTIDLYYHNGAYFEIEIDHREIALKEPPALGAANDGA